MQRFHYLIGLLLLFALCTTSCRKDGDDTPIIDINIDDQFFTSPWEALSPTQREFKLRIGTLSKQACADDTLDLDYEQDGQRFIISINDIVSSNECIGDSAIIESSINLGSLSEGTYQLEINLRQEIINKGQLKVDENQYELEMESEHGISLPHPTLLRVPSNTIWGFAAYNDTKMAAAIEQFLQELTSITTTSSLDYGYYGYFSNYQGQPLQLDDRPEGYVGYETFSRIADQNYTTIRNLVNRYRTDYGNQLEIKLFTADGREL